MRTIGILFAIISNSIAQVIYALSINRIYDKNEVEIAEDMRWWEMLLFGIYKHQKVSKEFATGLAISCLSFTVFTQYGEESVVVALIHTVLTTALFLTDKKYQLLPNTLVGLAFIIELLLQFLILSKSHFILNLSVMGFIVICFIISYWISGFTKNTMGGGDVKIIPFVALWQGIYIIAILPISFILILFYAIPKRKKTVAFGPFLIVGISITIILKPYIIQAIEALFHI